LFARTGRPFLFTFVAEVPDEALTEASESLAVSPAGAGLDLFLTKHKYKLK
jgi:hypothetical protein